MRKERKRIMKPSYANVIFEDLKNCLKQKNMDVYFVLFNDEYDVENFRNQFKQGSISAAIGLDVRDFEYTIDKIVHKYIVSDYKDNHIEYDFDYINTMPVELLPIIFMYTKDISQLAEFEELIRSLYYTSHKLSIEHPQIKNSKICFEFSIKKGSDFKRSQGVVMSGDRPTYNSGIRMIGYNCVSYTENYSTAQLELDKNVKPLIIKRLSALENIKSLLIEENENTNVEKIVAINTAWKELDTIVDGVQNITTYRTIYEVMKTNNCNADEALATIQENQEKKARREKESKQRKEKNLHYAEKMYSKKGDDILNLYTDIIVKDIRSKLNFDFPVFVYGGSTLSDFLKASKIKTIKYPSIVVWDVANFSFDIKQYQNIDNNGTLITHNFTQDTLPLLYGVNFSILTCDMQQENALKAFIEEHYFEESTIYIPSPMFAEESFPLHISVSEKKLTQDLEDIDKVVSKSLGSRLKKKTVYVGKQYPCVYHIKNYNKEDITDNQRLQFRLVQQAEFMLYCRNYLHQTLKKFDKHYVDLTQKQTSVMKSLLDAAFASSEYKKLKECFVYGKPIERALFENVLVDIVKFYPCLYDRMIQGYSVEQIRNEITNYFNYFEEKHKFLCEQLNIPKTYENDMHGGLRHFKALQYYMEQMLPNPECTIDIALKNYMQQCDKEKEELVTRNQAYLERRAEERENSSNGGFLSNMLEQKIESSNINRNAGKRGKRDLIGQAGCAKTQGGNCSNCALRFSCSRYFI